MKEKKWVKGRQLYRSKGAVRRSHAGRQTEGLTERDTQREEE